MTALFALRAVAILIASAGVFFLAYALARAPIAEASRLGLRGLKRKRALVEVALWSQVEPLVRWLGPRLSGWIAPATRERLTTKLALAGDFLGVTAEEFVALHVYTAAAGLLAGVAAGAMLGMDHLLAMVGLGYGLVAPSLALSNATTSRLKSVSRRLPHAIDLLALSMGAGLDFPASLRQVIEKSGNAADPLVEELLLILQSLHLGRTRRQALQELAARVPCDAVIDFVGSVVQAELRGTPVVGVLQIQAEVSRQNRSVRAEEAASKAGVKLLLPLVMVFVCVLVLVVAPIVMKLQQTAG